MVLPRPPARGQWSTTLIVLPGRRARCLLPPTVASRPHRATGTATGPLPPLRDNRKRGSIWVPLDSSPRSHPILFLPASEPKARSSRHLGPPIPCSHIGNLYSCCLDYPLCLVPGVSAYGSVITEVRTWPRLSETRDLGLGETEPHGKAIAQIALRSGRTTGRLPWIVESSRCQLWGEPGVRCPRTLATSEPVTSGIFPGT